MACFNYPTPWESLWVVADSKNLDQLWELDQFHLRSSSKINIFIQISNRPATILTKVDVDFLAELRV